jgi:hypothetical protein
MMNYKRKSLYKALSVPITALLSFVAMEIVSETTGMKTKTVFSFPEN